MVKSAGGVDVVLDFIGASYLQKNLVSLRPWGKLSVVGLLWFLLFSFSTWWWM